MKEAGLDCLSVGAGHLELRFSEKDVIEVERAKRIIQDMLKRGYALFVPVGDKGELQRVRRFIASTGTYIIADGPTIAPTPFGVPPLGGPGSATVPVAAPGVPLGASTPPAVRNPRGRPPKREKIIPMTQTKATVIGRSAGG